MPLSNCKHCNIEFKYHCSSIGKYCSKHCQHQGMYTEHVLPRILAGDVSERTTLKRYLIKEHGYQCMMCNISEWHGHTLSLELDHIDGNASNNFPKNLRLLCPNCHSITPTWKGRNKGNGRASRNLSLF